MGSPTTVELRAEWLSASFLDAKRQCQVRKKIIAQPWLPAGHTTRDFVCQNIHPTCAAAGPQYGYAVGRCAMSWDIVSKFLGGPVIRCRASGLYWHITKLTPAERPNCR